MKFVSIFCFLSLFLLLIQENLLAKQYTNDIPYVEIEKQVRIITNSYMELEKQFKEVKTYSHRALPRTGLNVSIKQNKETDFKVDAIQLSLDGIPVYGNIYSESQQNALIHGGRQLIYDAGIDEGLHVLTIKAYVTPEGKEKKISTESNGVQIQINKDSTFFLELQLSAKNNKPLIEFKQIGQKKGVLGIVK
jgi:hypothetical protein